MDQNAKSSRQLNRQFARSLILFLIALSVAGAATFAWYIYNTNKYTTDVNMAAGAGKSVYISNNYDDGYCSAIELKAFIGRLTPVSTDRISNGFQRVKEFEKRGSDKGSLFAKTFERSRTSDYYKTTLYMRSTFDNTGVYVSNIGFTDADSSRPISTAIRVGFVVHQAGRNKPVQDEFIFEISQEDNPMAMYNTATGQDGYVIDSTRSDGSTVPFSQLTSSNFCSYDSQTGETSLMPDSKKIATLSGADGRMGTPVQVDVYIWLEGCDKDCTSNLADTHLKNMALSFACDQ